MNCKRFQRWMRTSDGRTPPPELRAHFQDCQDCGSRFQAYERALEIVSRATEGACPPFPGEGAFRQLIAERRRRRDAGARSRRVRTWALPLAAGIAAATLWVRIGSEPPGIPEPVAGPSLGPVVMRAGGGAPDAWRLGLAWISPVLAGQTLESGAGIAFVYDDRTARVRLDPGTTVRVEAWDSGTTVLRLDEGRLEAGVLPRTAGQAFEVQTRFATVRVVGTRFTVAQDALAGTEVSVSEGNVQVRSLAGDRIALLPAGGTIRLGPGAEDAWPAPAIAPVVAVAPIPCLPAGASSSRHPAARTSGGRAALPAAPTGAVAPVPTAPAGEPVDLVTRIRALFAEGRFDDALALLARATEQPSPQRGRLLALTGDARLATGRVELARTAYEASLGAEWRGLPPEGVFLDLAQLLDERLQRGADAAAVWERYLAAYPQGRYVPRALLAVATARHDDGRPDEGLRLLGTLVAEWPDATQAATAVALLGRDAVERGDLDAAAGVFEPRVASRNPVVAEVALVGLMRVRLQQGRADEARRLEADYGRRFPAGLHRAEVDEVRRALFPVETQGR